MFTVVGMSVVPASVPVRRQYRAHCSRLEFCHRWCDVCIVCSADVAGVESVWSRWRDRSTVVEVDYDVLQSVLVQRCTLARLCTNVMPTAQLHSVFEDWATAARKASRFQVIFSVFSSGCKLVTRIFFCNFILMKVKRFFLSYDVREFTRVSQMYHFHHTSDNMCCFTETGCELL